MISATYFDGHNGKAHPVLMAINMGVMQLTGEDVNKSFSVAVLRFHEPFSRAAAFIDLGNGEHVEVVNEDDKLSVQRSFNYQPSLVVRLQSLWLGAIVAIIVMVVLLVSAYVWGIPNVTAALVDRLPASAEQKIGTEMLPVMDKGLLAPSGLSDERMAQARVILGKIRPANPRMPLRLVFRRSEALGANALALPDGTIVVTDKLIIDITKSTGDLQGEQANQLAGVLAHEIGHIEKRHTLKSMLSNSMALALASSLFGDFSTIATAAPTIAIGSAFSRDMESEADGYAIDLLKQHNISPACMADVFELLEADRNRAINDNVPKWMRVATDFTASHPSDASRIRRFREAAEDRDVAPPAPSN